MPLMLDLQLDTSFSCILGAYTSLPALVQPLCIIFERQIIAENIFGQEFVYDWFKKLGYDACSTFDIGLAFFQDIQPAISQPCSFLRKY